MTLDDLLSQAQQELRDGVHDNLSRAVAEARNQLSGAKEPKLLHETDIISAWQPEQGKLELALLGKYAEEVNELGTVIARCIIQGIREVEPVTGKPNHVWLEEEIADVGAAGGLVVDNFNLQQSRIAARFDRKISHLKEWHRLIREEREQR